MEKIIKVDTRHVKQLVDIDIESKYFLNKKFKMSRKENIKSTKERLKSKQEIIYAYSINGKLAGYCSIKPFFPGYKHCEFYWLAVSKEYQRRGVGTKLIAFREKLAKKMKFRKAFIYMHKKNDKIIRLYKKRGYKFVNEFPGYYSFKRNNIAVLYCKEL